MLKIGLTGGIGSGKSTVAGIFEVLGIPVYYADEAAKKLMNEEGELKEQILLLLGAGAFAGGTLDRKYVAGLVFHDPAKLEKLNALVHPATINDANLWFKQQSSPYAIKEAALIFESGAQDLLDYVIGVYTPGPLRIERVMQRDRLSHEEIISRMKNQLDEDTKMDLCNFVITNDEKHLVIPQVIAIHENLMAQPSCQDQFRESSP